MDKGKYFPNISFSGRQFTYENLRICSDAVGSFWVLQKMHETIIVEPKAGQGAEFHRARLYRMKCVHNPTYANDVVRSSIVELRK